MPGKSEHRMGERSDGVPPVRRRRIKRALAYWRTLRRQPGPVVAGMTTQSNALLKAARMGDTFGVTFSAVPGEKRLTGRNAGQP